MRAPREDYRRGDERQEPRGGTADLIGACAPVAGPALLCHTAALPCCWITDMQTVVCRHLGGGFCVQMRPQWNQNGSHVAPGGLLELLGLLKVARSSLGIILVRSRAARGPKRCHLDQLSAALRGTLRMVSAILGAKKLPNRRPKGFKIGPELKMIKPQSAHTARRILMIVEVPGFPFGGQNRYKTASDCILGAYWLLTAS